MESEKRMNGKSRLKKIFLYFVEALVAAGLMYAVFSAFAKKAAEPTYVSISAEEKGKNVTFRGAMVDDKWLNPSELVIISGNWVNDPEQETYTSTDGQPIRLILPLGKDRKLVFNVGPDEGTASVELNEENLEFDLYSDAEVESGGSYSVPDSVPEGLPLYMLILIAALYFALFMLMPRDAGRMSTNVLMAEEET